MKKLLLLTLLLVMASAPAAWAKVDAFVSILPQAYFVERIGGELVDVDVLVGPGQSPATYDPSPRQLTRLAQADVFFRIGVPFENRLIKKITGAFPDLNVVDTRRGVKLLHLDEHDHDGHAHHDVQDPHIWLDPLRVKIQAKTIADELARLDPDHADAYKKNLAAFHAELDRVDKEIKAMLAPYRGRAFMVFHPAYGYFADAYGLRQVAVERGGREPTPRQLAHWIDTARKNDIRIVFVQPQFSQNAAERLADSIDGAVKPMDPLAHDYLNNLYKMAREIAAALAR